MAKLINPLHSLTAAGAFALNITYTGSLGGPRAIRYKAPQNTGAPERKYLYKNGCKAWNLLPNETKTQWKQEGAARALSGFSAFMSYYLRTAQAAATIWDNGDTQWDESNTLWDVT